ncbi:hypothetical protein WJX84_005326 [Apatococcus fuscideae]|uniref:Uncharacterized protein n=1 Tax=Apatococcus fuscideae TaxID=2026836 RepID=A0AAW1TBC3_9CHLO
METSLYRPDQTTRRVITQGGYECFALPDAQASVYAEFVKEVRHILGSDIALSSLPWETAQSETAQQQAACLVMGIICLLRQAHPPGVEHPHLFCQLVGQTLGRLVHQDIVPLELAAHFLKQHLATINDYLDVSSVYANSWQCLLFMLEYIANETGIKNLQIRWPACNLILLTKPPHMDDVTGRQAQENCLRLFGFEKLQPLLENQPGPRDTAQAQWRWHERQALWLSLAAKPQPPEGLQGHSPAQHFRMHGSTIGVPVALRSQPASGLAANASSASGVTKDMGPEAMEKVEQELQEPTRKSNTEKNREKRQKRKAKLAAERQGASEAGSTTSMSQDGQPGSIPLAGRAASQDALTALKQLEDAPDARRLRPNSGQGAGAHSASSTAPGLVAGGHHGASQGDVAESFQPASGTVSSQGLIRSGQPGVSPLLVPDIRNIFTDKAEVKLIPGARGSISPPSSPTTRQAALGTGSEKVVQVATALQPATSQQPVRFASKASAPKPPAGDKPSTAPSKSPSKSRGGADEQPGFKSVDTSPARAEPQYDFKRGAVPLLANYFSLLEESVEEELPQLGRNTGQNAVDPQPESKRSGGSGHAGRSMITNDLGVTSSTRVPPPDVKSAPEAIPMGRPQPEWTNAASGSSFAQLTSSLDDLAPSGAVIDPSAAHAPLRTSSAGATAKASAQAASNASSASAKGSRPSSAAAMRQTPERSVPKEGMGKVPAASGRDQNPPVQSSRADPGLSRSWATVTQELSTSKNSADVVGMEAAIKRAVVWLSTAAGLQAPGVAQVRGALRDAKEWTRRAKQAGGPTGAAAASHGAPPPAVPALVAQSENRAPPPPPYRHAQPPPPPPSRAIGSAARAPPPPPSGPSPARIQMQQPSTTVLQATQKPPAAMQKSSHSPLIAHILAVPAGDDEDHLAASGSLPLGPGHGPNDPAPWDGLYITPLQGGWAQPGAQPNQFQPTAEPAPTASDVPIKLCRRCNQQKPVTDFYHSRANADGYDGRCKACDAVQCAMRRKRKPRVESPTVEEKACRRCGLMKPANNFYRNKTNADGLYNNCKSCFAEDAVGRRERLAPLEERTVSHKACKRCNEDKPSSEFYRNRLMADGLYSHCKSCYSQAATERSEQREIAPEKQCRRCRETKQADDFYHSKMTADGLQSYCKACYASAAANRRRQNASNRGGHDPDLGGDLSPDQLQQMQGGAMLMTGLEGMNGLSGPLGQLQPHEALAHMAGHLPHMVALSSQQQMQLPHMIQTYPAHEQLQMLQIPASQLPQLPSLGQSLPQLTSLGHLTGHTHSGAMQPQPFQLGSLQQNGSLRMQQVPVSLPDGSMSSAGPFMQPEGPASL